MNDQKTVLLLPEMIATLSREAPNVDVQLVPWQDSSFRDLAAGQLDLVVCPLTAPFPLVIERLLPDRFVCLVSRSHPHRKKSFSLTEYLAEKHIVWRCNLDSKHWWIGPCPSLENAVRLACVCPSSSP